MEKILLKGGNVHYTDIPGASYTVELGPVLIYLIPQKDGEDGRRLLLGEFEAGERFPGFLHDSQIYGRWVLGVVALEKATLAMEAGSSVVSGQELRMAFAERIGLRGWSADQFDEAIIEKYERASVKKRGAIYGVKREQDRIRQRSVRLVRDFFDKNTRNLKGDEQGGQTGKPLYDAAAMLCHSEKIDIAPLERIQTSSGRRFTIEDIARVSHFTIREVVLEKDWWRSDCGAMLAYRESDNAPVACIPRGPHRYMLYDPKADNVQRLTRELAADITPKAWVFYRPFPEKAITKMDLFRFGMAKVYKSDLVRLFVMVLIGTIVGLLLPFLNEQIYDKYIPMGNAAGLLQFGAVLLACSLGNIAFTIVKNLASFRSMNTMEYAVQAAAFDRLFNLPQSFLRKYDAAHLGQRVMGLQMIYDALAESLITSLLSAVFSLLYLWRMFAYSAKMTGFSLLLLGAVMAFILVMGVVQIRSEREKRQLDLKAQSQAFQMINGVSKIRNAFAEDRAIYNYMQNYVQSRGAYRKIRKIQNTTAGVAEAAPILFSVIFYYMMVRQSIGLTVGQFNGFTAAFGAFSGAMLTIVQNFLTVNMIKPLYEDVKPILETLPEISEESQIPGDLQGEIELDNVTFGYDPEEPPVLRGLSLHVRPGEYLGVVGSSGCGKSTLLKLLLGFETPQVGRVYYDSRDIDELDKRELRKKFGVVLQDGGLISGSIYDNITITAPNVSMERVEEAVREVGLEEDIEQMPMGLHTVVSEGAGTISGGQAQRILIARAIMGKPKVIFLDEATSALDNVTQEQVVETLEKMNATKIVIAHRLSTVRNCDRIIVMDKGRIVEQGDYQNLMDQKGLFYDLAIRQIS